MKVIKTRFGVTVATVLVAGGAMVGLRSIGWDGFGQAVAATSAQKAEFQQILTSLQAVDTAYVSGNSAEAQAQFDNAKSNWDKVSSAISKREAREAQLLFDSLGTQLKAGSPPAKVKSMIDSMLRELRSDTGRKLQ
jgi:hypothetical protein